MTVLDTLQVTKSVISINGVTKAYGAMTAVDGVDLDIGEGEFLSLLGPSGCGKTRGPGQHGRPAGRVPVQHGAELGPGVSDGGHVDGVHPRDRGDRGRRCAGSSRARPHPAQDHDPHHVQVALVAFGALARAKHRAGWVMVLTGLLAMTLVTPEIVDGISFLPWFVTLGTDAGIAPLNNGMVRSVIAHTCISIAVVTFIVRARMQGMDESIEEAAADLYASPWNRFRQITLPLAGPGILAGALMAFSLSLDNTIVASFVQVPGYTPWPVYIFGSLKVGLRPEIAAVSTLMLLLTLFALAVVAYVLRRMGESTDDVAAALAGG